MDNIALIAAPETEHDRRVLQARLQIVVDSLMATIIFNPLLTAICLPAFAIAGSPFGSVAAWRLGLAEGLQLLSACFAFFVYRRHRQVDDEGLDHVHALLVFAQTLFSTVWGVIAFLFWLPGNPVNQVFIVMLMAVVSYSADDASLNNANLREVGNWLGPLGAVAGDLLLQIFGVAAVAFLAPLFVWGARALRGKSLKYAL